MCPAGLKLQSVPGPNTHAALLEMAIFHNTAALQDWHFSLSGFPMVAVHSHQHKQVLSFFFFTLKKHPQIYLVFTVFSSLDSGPNAGSDPVLTAVMGTQQIPVDVN